jgi:hypothetical protein
MSKRWWFLCSAHRACIAHGSLQGARGDTLVKIADRFGVSLEDLHRWNHLDRHKRRCRASVFA